MEDLMILLQRRYNAIYELKRLTEELQEAGRRRDPVSVNLLLQMRADEMEKIDRCQGEIQRMSRGKTEEEQKIRRLMSDAFLKEKGTDAAEEKVRALRKKTQEMIDRVKILDRQFNISVAGKKSYYK